MEQNKLLIYESPQLDVVEIFSEGVLCQSGVSTQNESLSERNLGSDEW